MTVLSIVTIMLFVMVCNGLLGGKSKTPSIETAFFQSMMTVNISCYAVQAMTSVIV